MKNMNPKVKKWLAVAGGLALCAVLVVAIALIQLRATRSREVQQ